MSMLEYCVQESAESREQIRSGNSLDDGRRSYPLSDGLIQGFLANDHIASTSCHPMACLNLSLPTEHSTNVTLCWTSEWPWSGSWWPLGKLRQAVARFHACGADEAGLLRPWVEIQSTFCIKFKDIVKDLVPQCKPHWSTLHDCSIVACRNLGQDSFG